jgi:hypothetical protein
VDRSVIFLLSLTIFSAATIGSVVVYRQSVKKRLAHGEAPKRPELKPGIYQGEESSPILDDGPAEERRLETLRIGDIVMEEEEDWLIVETLTYQEENDTWWVHTLDDGKFTRLLEVRKISQWTATLLKPVEDLPVFGDFLDGITYRHMHYDMQRRGDARIRSGRSPKEPARMIQYALYVGTDGSSLNIEDWPSDKRVFLGEVISEHRLSFFPGKAPEPNLLSDLSL